MCFHCKKDLEVSEMCNESEANEDLSFDIDNYVYPFGLVRKSLIRSDMFQIYQIQMSKEARVVIRRSESACSSTTLRFYIEVHMDPEDNRLLDDRKEILQRYITTALKVTKIQEFFSEDIAPVIV
ncbi:unnamed protein product [Larinioides sclopetarius]|uniref:Uncharacterized protein n=1 Tax=Larinioides sclopetarius TaxID=280406 RepID=A0AAV2AB72_9ARAC